MGYVIIPLHYACNSHGKDSFLRYGLRYVVVYYFRVSLYTFSLWALVLFCFVLSFLCLSKTDCLSSLQTPAAVEFIEEEADGEVMTCR